MFVTKMPVMRILDLAQAMIELLAPAYGYDPEDLEIRFIGPKSGEKLYEELLSTEEMVRTMELRKMFVVLPALRGFYRNISYAYKHETSRPVHRPYISSQEKPLTVEEIRNFLLDQEVLREYLLASPVSGLRTDGVLPEKVANLAAAGLR